LNTLVTLLTSLQISKQILIVDDKIAAVLYFNTTNNSLSMSIRDNHFEKAKFGCTEYYNRNYKPKILVS